MSLRLEGCSRDRERRMELQCLGHWQGEDGQQYLALLDTELPQLGEEPRPRYRCAIYHRQGDLTHLALSNDSTCVHQLERHDRGAEVFTLRREERSRSPVSVQEWVASLPENNNIDGREPRTEDGIETEADIDGDDNLTLGAEGE